MLLDRYLPRYDVTQVVELGIDAPPQVAYAAAKVVQLHDPLISALFAVREFPSRVARWWRREKAPPAPGPISFDAISRSPGWVVLGEKTGTELVGGSVGKFWRRDYGGRAVAADEFVSFNEPGYAKLAASLGVRPNPSGGSVLRYEARTLATDDEARRTFLRYWRVIHPGVAMVMGRALKCIKREAERRGQLQLTAAGDDHGQDPRHLRNIVWAHRPNRPTHRRPFGVPGVLHHRA